MSNAHGQDCTDRSLLDQGLVFGFERINLRKNHRPQEQGIALRLL